MCDHSLSIITPLFNIFFFNHTATTEIYTYLHTLSLHDALPISNVRLGDDLDICVDAKVPAIIASVGSPVDIIERVHAYGGIVISDAASVKHARRAAEAGVDGLILLTAGAGGNTGWLNPLERKSTRLNSSH